VLLFPQALSSAFSRAIMAGKELYLAQLGPNIAQRLADKTYKKRRAAAIAVQM